MARGDDNKEMTDFEERFMQSLVEELREMVTELRRMNANYELEHGIKYKPKQIQEEDFH